MTTEATTTTTTTALRAPSLSADQRPALVYLARLNAVWLIPFAFFFSFLIVGGDSMPRRANVPTYYIEMLEGLMLIFFVILTWHLLDFPSASAVTAGPFANPGKFVGTMLLPWIVIAVLNAAFYVRLTRNQVLETLDEDYVRTARAKGLRERTVVVKHALRAGLTPIVTAAGLDIAYLLGGAIITESIFSLPGMGTLAVGSVVQSDLPIITGITLVAGFFIIAMNLIVDLLYGVLDPRVRVS